MAKRLSAKQLDVGVRLVLLGPILMIVGALSFADEPLLAGVLFCLGILVLVIAIYRIRTNERLERDERRSR